MSGISSVLLLVIVIFAAVFFLFGIFHLLTRHFMATSSSYQQSNNRSREYEASSSSSSSSSSPASQLQHLFRLHDSGLDQSIIDALPVFRYSDVMNGGSVEPPFDCSVCLSEFSGRDSLRLLPLCSHAFHTHCIDTWLLSNSTCPLCRSHIGASTAVAVAESPLREEGGGVGEGLNGSFKTGISKRVFSVRLGKLRSFVGGNNGGGGGAAGSGGGGGLDGRRC